MVFVVNIYLGALTIHNEINLTIMNMGGNEFSVVNVGVCLVKIFIVIGGNVLDPAFTPNGAFFSMVQLLPPYNCIL